MSNFKILNILIRKIKTFSILIKLYLLNIYFKLKYNLKEHLQYQEDIFKKLNLSREEALIKLKKIINMENDNLYYSMKSEHLVLFSAISQKFINVKILEIGTYDGNNVKILSKLFPLSSITTIDLDENDKNFIDSYERENLDKKEKHLTIRELNLKNLKNVKFLKMNSVKLIDEKDKFDLIWIDGAHGNPIVTMDIINSINILNERGIIMCDDVWVINPPFGDDNYNSSATFKTLKTLKDNKIIDFALAYKRLDKQNNCNPYNRKYVAVVKKL